jgi:hypothetical protein
MELFSDNIEISKKAHFVYFYNKKSKRSTEWDLMRYIAIKSFAVENPGFELNFYTNEMPVGEYWERASEHCRLHIVEPETEIFGNPLIHPAHISDVFRLKLLLQEGGVYSDFDTITIKSFEPLLRKNKFVVADQTNGKVRPGNGVIATPADSLYMKTWLELFRGFRSKGKDEYWDELSVKAHKGLMENTELAGTFELLPREYFYPYTMYDYKGLYLKHELQKISEKAISVHLYDTFNIKYVNSFTEKQIIENPEACSYSALVNRYLA